MNYSFFIGIDVSKLKLDVAIKNASGQLIRSCVVDNTSSALIELLNELEKEIPLTTSLFCLEPTGHYSNTATITLMEMGVKTWLATPADIQRSIGMTRGKSDKVDAIRIAEYAYRYSDKARFVSFKDLEMLQIKELLTQRETFVVDKAKYLTQLKDFKGQIPESAYEAIEATNRMVAETLLEAIKTIEKRIEQIINASQSLRAQQELLLSIPGIGKILAQNLIAATSGFERFNNPRAFACHAGIAPFNYTSGSSIKSQNRISHRANKKLKTLLHMAALCSIRMKGELQVYYTRKVAEGKSKMSVLNAIRNKIIHCAFAVINRKTPYQNLEVS